MKPLIPAVVLMFVYAISLPVPGVAAAEVASLKNVRVTAVRVASAASMVTEQLALVKQPRHVVNLAHAVEAVVVQDVGLSPAAVVTARVARVDSNIRANGDVLTSLAAKQTRATVGELHGF